MTHEEIKILISAYADGEVTPSEKNIVEEHLSTCAECQKDYKAYKGMSFSLSKWSNERLSPDEEINVQRKFEHRREPMFTKQSLTALTTTLVLTLVIGSVVVPNYMKRAVQGRLKSASDDIGDQYSPGRKKAMAPGVQGGLYQPSYLSSNYSTVGATVREARLAEGTVSNAALATITKGEAYDALALGGGIPRATRSGIESSEYYQSGNAPSTADEEERKKIQRADLTLRVENAFKTKAQLTDIVTQLNGIIESSTFSRSPEGSGQGTMVCKVYPKELESALQQIRKLGEVQTENQGSTDVTDRYADAQKNMTKYQADKERLEKSLKDFKLFNPTTEAEKESIKQQILQTQEALKALERVIHFYQEQTTMSIVTVNYYDNYKTISKDNDTASQWKVRLGDKWKTTIDASTEVFTNILFGSIFMLSYIVPLLIWCGLFAVIYFIVRMFIKK